LFALFIWQLGILSGEFRGRSDRAPGKAERHQARRTPMTGLTTLLAQLDDGGAGGAAGAAAGLGMMVLYFGLVILMIIGMWKVFEKAGKPGWAAIVPFYNTFVLTEIAGKPVLWFILLFIPCVGIIILLMISMEIAKAFGKGQGFGVGLFFLPSIFYPMLGFGDARYTAPVPATM
jgi:hypothetical protein